MYVVAEGLLDVYIQPEDAKDLVKVAALIPGQVFGEMSLLTGEPRSATVKAATGALVYEITKEVIAALLEKRPEIAEQLAQIIAEHRLRDAERRQALPADQQEAEIRNFAGQLLDKMRRFFQVFRRSAPADPSGDIENAESSMPPSEVSRDS